MMNFDIEIENLVQKEYECSDIISLNVYLKKHNCFILYANIRSLNNNLEKLELLLNRLRRKPTVIVCREMWMLQNIELYNLPGYNLRYNESDINKSDGIILYIKNDIIENTETINIGRLTIIHTDILINNNETVIVSATYRSHSIKKLEFVSSIKKYINCNINIKNHMIIGDFIIDIMYGENISHEFLNNFSEKEYVPCFLGITRPANDGCNGTCIDIIFSKSNPITPKAYKLCTNEISDHYPLIVAVHNVTIKQVNNRLINFINYKKLLNKANLTEWNSIFSIHDPNGAGNMLISKIKNCQNNASFCKTNKKEIGK